MKTPLILLFTLIVCFTKAQKNEGCKSSQKTKYEDSLRDKWKTYSFKPISKEDALKPLFGYIEIDYVNKPAKFEDIVDSLHIQVKQILAEKKVDENDFEKELMIRDSLGKIEAAKIIGNISKPFVIKSEKRANKWAILFEDFKYDEMLAFGSGYWLSLSEDDGKSWKKYYTGLTGGKNYYFKKNSNPSLWRDDNHIQIEADIVRMTEERAHPMPPQYETVKDNALIVLNIADISKDSDGDGLTDIEEKNLFLNPFSKDTDGDGIVDSEDMNPRFASTSNDFIKLYEGIMFGENVQSDGKHPYEDRTIDLTNPLKKDEKSELQQDELLEDFHFLNTTKLLVTSDPNLQRINPKHYKIIILTPKEFEEYQNLHHSELEKLNYSPLFKCDKDSNSFLLDSSASYSGQTYKIQRTKIGWKIITISSWIS
ncbi:hypothetical protein [Epilithonimonas zeae]|uniref:hypothetical protein n=1 Tax=Epilithonimonas zeae TaxID=1416779 RepID=UPI00200D26C4|nr:hypothetical protein [Epilithonimonas zeae]UQB67517.1 hypothetical protein KI430_10745 [Epilithonimonas zeae]